MFNDAWFEWLRNSIQFILDSIKALVTYSNPLYFIAQLAEMAIGLLPEPANLFDFYLAYLSIMNWLAPSFQLINHFVNLPVYATAILALMVIEGLINIFRAWRIIRSFVT